MNGTKEKPSGKRAKAKVIRPLGYLERFEAALHWLGFYKSSMVTCRFVMPASLMPPGPDNLPAALTQKVESAIALIVLEHPMLRVGLRNEHARKPVFVELESVDFRNHIEWRILSPSIDYEAELLKLIRDRLDVKVESPETKPAWRILVLHIAGTDFVDVMFEWGHAHIDGISVKLFHEDLLRKLNNGEEAGSSVFKDRVLTIPPEKRRDLLPPLHDLCEFPITTRWALTTLWKGVKPPVLSGKSDLVANWAPIQRTPYVTQYRHFGLNNNTLQNVLTACREHRTTLTGLLQTLTMFSLATRLTPEEARGFIGTTVVNLRPIMSSKFLQSYNIDPKKTMANFVTMVDHEYDTELVAKIRARTNESSDKETHNCMAKLEELVWPTAERVRADLQKRLDEGRKNDQMGLMKFIPDFRLLLKDWVKKPRVYSLSVTNLGVVDGNPSNADTTAAEGDQSGKWTIDRAVFSVSPEVHQAAFVICPVAVNGRELYVSCDWQEAAMDTMLAEGIVADLESWLRYFGR
ncbi:alcohol acetyltransferase-domain-containing protein [Hypoxylon cercidicola]|nr:alcohol acetyltransferase-domain-containing protein [Hypoxylon cercidicola]